MISSKLEMNFFFMNQVRIGIEPVNAPNRYHNLVAILFFVDLTGTLPVPSMYFYIMSHLCEPKSMPFAGQAHMHW